MNLKKVWKPLLFSSVVLGTMALSFDSSDNANALGKPEALRTVPVGTKIKLNDYGVTEQPARFKWGPNTRVVVEKEVRLVR